VSDSAFRGAFRHQHGDPKTLMERIDAQLRERVEEAVEMGALEILVEARRREGRSAPEDGNARDREEFHALAAALLAHLDQALAAILGDEARPDLERARAGAADLHAGRIAVQAHLAKRLPDYWQRFDEHRRAFGQLQASTAEPSTGWLRRLFKG
jgi:hypothetical protein